MEEQIRNLTMSKCFVISLVLAGVYYGAAYNDGTALEAQISAKEQELNKNRADLTTVKKALEEAANYEKRMSELSHDMQIVLKAIPKDITGIELMKIISNEAKVVGVQIDNLAAKSSSNYGAAPTDAKANIYSPVSVDLVIRGTYNQMMLFLSNLTKLDKIINTSDLNIAAQQNVGTGSSVQAPTLDMKVMVEAYKYIPPPEDKKSDGATTKGGDPDA